MLEAIVIAVSMLVGLLLGRSMVSAKKVTITRAPDIERLDYLETTKQSAFYNDTAKAWAVLDTAGKPIKACRSLRAAIDFARGQSNA